MKIKVYLLWMAVAFIAFIFGISIVSSERYFQSFFSAKTEKTELVEPAKIEEINLNKIIFPPRKVEQTEISGTPMMDKKDDSEKETESVFDAEGGYYIIGKLPKGFKDFESLSITTKDYRKASAENDWEGIPIPPEGSVFMKKEFKFVRLNIADKQISFETESKKGISYKFVGKFIAEEEIKIGEYPEYAVLEGSLIKMRDGQKIAESKVKFGVMSEC